MSFFLALFWSCGPTGQFVGPCPGSSSQEKDSSLLSQPGALIQPGFGRGEDPAGGTLLRDLASLELKSR